MDGSSTLGPDSPELRSVFAEFPWGVHVNVMEGNAHADYLSFDKLAEEIGPSFASYVTVVPTPQAVHDYFESEQISVRARSTWNYARTLRSYGGRKHLLLLEDDIEFAENFFKHLHGWLDDSSFKVLSLFNDRNCARSSLATPRGDSEVKLEAFFLGNYGDFHTTQGIGYTKDVAHAAGDYLLSRAGREAYDVLLGRVIGQAGITVGIPHPSVVQHTGVFTTGLSAPQDLPISGCYQEKLSP